MKYFLCLLLSFSAVAREIRMVQVDKTFMGDITDAQAAEAFDNPAIEEKHKVETLKLSVGDRIKFLNRDEVSHNVSGSLQAKTEFDVKLQEPGSKNDRVVELNKKGDYIIQCAIHPKMKIKVKVD